LWITLKVCAWAAMVVSAQVIAIAIGMAHPHHGRTAGEESASAAARGPLPEIQFRHRCGSVMLILLRWRQSIAKVLSAE